ncbi:MAG: STAS domain-containing protein, partial [Thermodesulfobacteriota bacterium]|nr:STAS domain-containing protein [Thermodesulfobacteriota bacterium]
ETNPQNTWAWEEDAQTGTVRISGEVDFSSSPGVKKRFKKFIKDSKGAVALDLSDLSYLDSSGLAVLIEARRKLKEKKRSLKVTAIHAQVEKIFKLTQVMELFGL